jgi:hypothetical protein
MSGADGLMQRLGRLLDKLENRMSGLGRRESAGEERAEQREPVEIRLQVLREIGSRVQPTGRGDYYFPATGVRLTLNGPFLLPYFSNPQFELDLKEELVERGCPANRVPVVVEIVEGSGPPFGIELLESPRKVPEAERPVAYLVIVRGSASVTRHQVGAGRVYLGRMAEVRHKDGSLIRRNDIPFDESEDTVSRKHAWVQYESGTGRYRVYNDPTNTERGTQVVRNGSTIRSDAVRGVELRDADEIHLGNAIVRFETGRRPLA